MSKRSKKRKSQQASSCYQSLETRCLLNADFGFSDGQLTLSNFTNSNVVVANEVRYEQTAVDTYNVILSEGTWSGSEVAGVVTGNGTNVLTLNNTSGEIASLLHQNGGAPFDIEFRELDFNGDLAIAATSGDISLPSLGVTGQLDIFSSGDILVGAVMTSDSIDITGGSIGNFQSDLAASFQGDNVSLTSNHSIDIGQIQAGTDVTLNAGVRITVDSITAGNDVSADTGAFLSTQSVEATGLVDLIAGTNQIANRVIADTIIIEAIEDVGVNDIQGNSVTVLAGDDIFDTQWLDGLGVTTELFEVVAGNANDDIGFNGIALETDVPQLVAAVNGNTLADLVIVEASEIILDDVFNHTGSIRIQANGTISADRVSTFTADSENQIRLDAIGAGSEIVVGVVDAGDLGSVDLISGDDVTSVDDFGFLNASDLFVRAENQSSSLDNGIRLRFANVASATLVVEATNELNPTPGDISLFNSRPLAVPFAGTANGKISLIAIGNLVAEQVAAAGVTDADAIRLTALGVGADVVTGNVSVENRAGGVILTADDDVRDANPDDDLVTVADTLTVTAGNNLDDNFNGILLQSRALSLDASVLAGDSIISIDNTGFLTINNASQNLGGVNVRNNGFLRALDIGFATFASDNFVFLNTVGENSTIEVGRISAEEGVIVIDSEDDIFDTDTQDDLFVTSNFLRATARNGRPDAFDGIILSTDVNSVVTSAELGEVVLIDRGP